MQLKPHVVDAHNPALVHCAVYRQHGPHRRSENDYTHTLVRGRESRRPLPCCGATASAGLGSRSRCMASTDAERAPCTRGHSKHLHVDRSNARTCVRAPATRAMVHAGQLRVEPSHSWWPATSGSERCATPKHAPSALCTFRMQWLFAVAAKARC